MKRNNLKQELGAAGNNQKDIEKLMGVVDALKATPLPSLSDATRHKIANIPGEKSRAPLFTFVSLGSAFAVFLVLVVAAQFALPGSPLYGIKRGTEYIRALIQPSYKEDLVEVRKQELETLEKEAAPDALINEAVTEYEKASREKSPAQPQEQNTDRRDRNDSNTEERRDWRNRDTNDRWNDRRDSNERNSRDDNDSGENNWSWR